ncbi:MAG: DUF922 domain-containing protein [Anaerolineae bacterium]
MQRYQVAGKTLEEVSKALPEVVGQFHHDAKASWDRETTPESELRVTRVTLPVKYNYVMPEWIGVSQQPLKIREAWNKFYGDLLTHEREHLRVSQRYYNQLKGTLEALPADERTEARVQEEIETSTTAQNETHASHTGFTTPSTYYLSDYMPKPETPGNASGEDDQDTESAPEGGTD